MTEETRKRSRSTQVTKQEEPKVPGPVQNLEEWGEVVRLVIAHELAPLQVELATLVDQVAALSTGIAKMRQELFLLTTSPETEEPAPETPEEEHGVCERKPSERRLYYREGLPVTEPMPIQLVGGGKK